MYMYIQKNHAHSLHGKLLATGKLLAIAEEERLVHTVVQMLLISVKSQKMGFLGNFSCNGPSLNSNMVCCLSVVSNIPSFSKAASYAHQNWYTETMNY